MKIQFALFAERGHFNPLIGVAQHLQHAGHELAFFCPEDIRPQLSAAGLSGPCCFPPPTSKRHERSERSVQFSKLLADRQWAERWYELVLLTKVPRQVDALREAVRQFRPDVICTDPLCYAAPIVATQEGIPWAGLSAQWIPISPSSLRYPYLDILEGLGPKLTRLFASYQVPIRFARGYPISPWLNTVFAIEALLPRALSGNTHSTYVGPSAWLGKRGDEVAFPWDRLDPARRLLLISGGSQHAFDPATIRSFIEAVDPHETQIVASLNRSIDDPALQDLPPHVIAAPYVPQLQLLARAHAFVNHGGTNGVMEALAAGCPQLVVALGVDQPLFGWLVDHHGVGRSLAVGDVSAGTCREVFAALLALDGPYARRAREVAKLAVGQDGARATAERVIELAIKLP